MSRYTLSKKQERDIFVITIVADSNDADYITTIEKCSRESFEDYVLEGLINLRECASDSHELEDYSNEYDLSIPYNGWDGYCHTLISVTVEYIDHDGNVWDVQY